MKTRNISELFVYSSAYDMFRVPLQSDREIYDQSSDWIGDTFDNYSDYLSGAKPHRNAESLASATGSIEHGALTIELEYDVTGSFCDIGAHLSGEHECMISPVVTNSGIAPLSVLLDLSVWSKISSENLLEHRLRLAEILFAESRRRIVSLVCFIAWTPKGNKERAQHCHTFALEIGPNSDLQQIAIALDGSSARMIFRHFSSQLSSALPMAKPDLTLSIARDIAATIGLTGETLIISDARIGQDNYPKATPRESADLLYRDAKRINHE
jgi:hypothetical protein